MLETNGLIELRRQMIARRVRVSAFGGTELACRMTARDVPGRCLLHAPRLFPARVPVDTGSTELRTPETHGLTADPLRYLSGRNSVSKAA